MTLHRRHEGPLLVWTFDRPAARNAIDRATMTALEEAVAAAEQDSSAGALILCGRGPTFVAGGDLKDFRALDTPEAGRTMSLAMQSVLDRLEALPLLTVAALDGDALGGGTEIALSCDAIVMRRGASLAFKQRALGLTPGWGGGRRLAERVGPRRALWLFAEAALLDAEAAFRLGVIDRIAEDEGEAPALAEATSWLRSVLPGSLRALKETKRQLWSSLPARSEARRQFEADRFAACWGSPEHEAALDVFFAKSGRSPQSGG